MCSDYTRPNYANYSDDVDIFAPGGADGNDRNYSDADRVYSTDLDGGYSYKWGTSMACPHVSGIAALVIAHYGVGHPGFTVEECREILLRSYRSVSEYVEPKYDGKLGVGLADAGMIFLEDAGTAPGYGFGACRESHGKGARTGMDGSGRRQRVARSGVPADLYGPGHRQDRGQGSGYPPAKSCCGTIRP